MLTILNKISHRIDGYGLFNLIYGHIKWFFISVYKIISKNKFKQVAVYDSKMIVDLYDDGLSKQLLKYGARELDHKYLLEMILKPDTFVLDIGANIGYYALLENKLIGPGGKLVCIEPSPSNVSLLTQNMKLNNLHDVTIMEGAISESSGTKTFYLSHESNLNTFHNYGTVEKHLSGEQIEVSTYSVPDLISELDILEPLGLIRMDVEGHEVDVISGMLDGIKSLQLSPTIIFETHISRYSPDNDMENILKELFQNGYSVPWGASSWQEGTKIVESLGYKSVKSIPTDGVRREIYKDISNADAINLICNLGGLRTVVLSKK